MINTFYGIGQVNSLNYCHKGFATDWFTDMTEFKPLPSSTAAPDFTLTDLIGGSFSLSKVEGKKILLNFWSIECAWCQYYDEYFVTRGHEWAEQGVQMVMINSNDNEPVEAIREKTEAIGLTIPVLIDKGNRTADSYGVMTTPHLFLLDENRIIRYQGAVDDRSFRQREATINYLEQAINSVLRNESPAHADIPAYGCTIVRALDL